MSLTSKIRKHLPQRFQILTQGLPSLPFNLKPEPRRSAARRSLIMGSSLLGGLGLALAVLVAGNRLINWRQAKNSGLPKPINVNPQSFTGQWYEIARTPLAKQQPMQARLNYQLTAAQELTASYTYQLEQTDQETPAQKEEQSRLRIPAHMPGRWYKRLFFGLLEEPEWILELGENYSYAVLGSPSRQFLRILSRLPVMAPETYTAILERMAEQGFDTHQLQLISQNEKAPAPLFAHLQDLQQKKRKHYQSGAHLQQQGPQSQARNGWRMQNERPKKNG